MFQIDEKQNIKIVRGDSGELNIAVFQEDGQGGTIEYEMQEGDTQHTRRQRTGAHMQAI